jgi:ABC-type glycerol-3-phosphate transport system substrate-binding protein
MRFEKKKVIGILFIFAIVLVFILIPKNEVVNFKDKYVGVDNLNVDVEGIGRVNTYSKYLEQHQIAPYPTVDIHINITNFEQKQGVQVLKEFEGEKNVILTEENSYVEWKVDVPEAGMYQMHMNYFTVEGRGVDIERKLYINGEVPFLGADTLSFSRLWTDKKAVIRDNQGNDIRPSQINIPTWTSAFFKDDMGYYTEPYSFYLEKGNNTVGLESVNEPVIIKSLTLTAIRENISYEEYKKNTTNSLSSDLSLNYKQVIQGEVSTLRSSPSLYAIYDRSAPNTEPYSVSDIRLNMIGGNAWRVPGQWIEWVLNVPEDGYYNITIKGRQNYNRGFVSSRTLYIDGKIPFKEVENVSFKYSNEWESITLSEADNKEYEFYLTKGNHTLRMEVTLGDLGDILNDMNESVYRLNEIYRKILILTGTTPDKYRDYKIEKVYPEVIAGMDLESKRLYKLIDDIVGFTGEKASQVASLQTLAEQLEKFVKNPAKIPKTFVNFKENISAMGTTILTLSEAPLDIDYITITGLNEEPAMVKANFVDKVVHEIKSFVASFTEDYNAVGDVYAKDEAIEVWILSGRDQSTVLKTMIDDSFTPESNIAVNVKLVEAATLLNAVISGTGPDVVLSAAQAEPVNYALRNAVEDLTQFEGYEEVFDSYNSSAYTPFIFEGGIYGIPETQNFSVLFYRTDILEELEIEVPKTWNDFINILPTIHQNNMTVAVPSSELSVYFALLYQKGGALYDEDGKSTLISSESGVEAFDTFTKLFTQYKLPVIYDFPNRFRSGEMPIGIQDYSLFNTLVVFAPEIRGLWDFTLIPGTYKEDGTIDHSSHTSSTSSMLLKQDNEIIKQNSWEFLKWWSSAETQLRFGQEMESVLGASARYATANMDAFDKLSWSNSQMEVLKEQRSWTVGIREIAGGYYTGRHITNAIRKIIFANEEPRETLLDYTRTINDEILKKRLEFGMDNR